MAPPPNISLFGNRVFVDIIKLMKARKDSLSFYLSKFSAESPGTKNRLTKEKHTNLFNIIFMDHGSLHKEMQIQSNS